MLKNKLTYNYHTHTPRCNHASGSEREYIEHAISAGIKTLGFSDHAPLLPSKMLDHTSGIRMDIKELENYCTILDKLKAEYKGQIDLHIGLELEYFGDDIEKLRKVYLDYGIEYLLLGSHFIDAPVGVYYSGELSNNPDILKKYVDISIEGMSTGYFTYLAHPDLINFCGDKAIYEKEMLRLCEGALKYDVPLELNILGFLKGRNYPCEQFFNIAKGCGNRIVYGYDAHNPNMFDNTDVLTKAFTLAETCGLNVEMNDIELRKL